MNNSFFQKTALYVKTHKITSILVGLGVLIAGYFIIHAATAKTPAPTYAIGTVQKGTIVSTVTGSGQISTSESVNLQPQVSGPLVSVRVKAGDSVSRGQALFSISATDAARAVETARESVTAAQLDLRSTQTQAINATADNAKAVKTAYTTLLSSGLQAQPADLTTSGYQAPTISGNYALGMEGTITVTTYSSEGGISYAVTGLTSGNNLTSTTSPQPIGDSGLYILFASPVKGGLTWTITIPNKNSSSYLSNENAYQTALENQSQAEDQNGSAAVTLQGKQLAVTQAQNNLASAEETLAKYTVTAPFSGTIATVPVNVGDQVSASTTLGTIITTQEVVTLALNEVDVSKVQRGDKATLSFDAISGLTLAGTVSNIDPVGTVASGVVNYTVTISLDTQDPRVKSGMSVTAAIQAAVAQDVLEVPSSAVKTTNGSSYVLTVPSDTPATTGISLAIAPVQTSVQIGITDGTATEITSGLNEGDKIVTKTIAATGTTAAKATTAAPSLLGGGGGATRAAGRIGG
ncbi:MAG: family efflux transporter subunit, HlyD family secretion protein [Candidatus Nomurabacteria bacterium]|nr:family efflux transporter subunit, HlyD family secretion protein [Candidatus Nomurabacteria bacterium]